VCVFEHVCVGLLSLPAQLYNLFTGNRSKGVPCCVALDAVSTCYLGSLSTLLAV
jgi:hypothetical protein